MFLHAVLIVTVLFVMYILSSTRNVYHHNPVTLFPAFIHVMLISILLYAVFVISLLTRCSSHSHYRCHLANRPGFHGCASRPACGPEFHDVTESYKFPAHTAAIYHIVCIGATIEFDQRHRECNHDAIYEHFQESSTS